jgi:hypothetical protein
VSDTVAVESGDPKKQKAPSDAAEKPRQEKEHKEQAIEEHLGKIDVLHGKILYPKLGSVLQGY